MMSLTGAAQGSTARLLVVDDDASIRRALVQALTESGYAVREASTFAEAKRLLQLDPPDLLITDVRLQEFNGLQLVLLSQAVSPNTRAIVMTGYSDPVIEGEARRYGADYISKPFEHDALLAMVAEKLNIQNRQRRWPRRSLTAPVHARVVDVAIRIVDVSYGGFRFEASAPPWPELTKIFDIEFAEPGFSIGAEPVWMLQQRETSAPVLGGASIVDADPHVTDVWRQFVDRVAAEA
jgi:ActR/RegA family two-component response regulator